MLLTRRKAIHRSTSKPRKEKKKRVVVDPLERAERWASMIDGKVIKTQADLARHLGLSRARVSQVLSVRGVRGARRQNPSCESEFAGPIQ